VSVVCEYVVCLCMCVCSQMVHKEAVSQACNMCGLIKYNSSITDELDYFVHLFFSLYQFFSHGLPYFQVDFKSPFYIRGINFIV